MSSPHGLSRAKRDLVFLLAGVTAFAAVSMHWELAEYLGQWSHAFEALQADELSLTLVVLSLGCAWFAFRRLHDAKLALTARGVAQQQVDELLVHNRELTQRLITAQEDERRWLARELHDEIAQTCTALRIEAAWIGRAQPADWAQVVVAAERIGHTSTRMHGLVRDMLKRLRPPDLDGVGLVEALQALCNSWEEQHGVACGLYASLEVRLSDEACVSLYRVVQEALNNIARHARASQVKVTLTATGSSDAAQHAPCLHLTIQDNGQGMPAPGRGGDGLGLLGMRERMAALGGTIDWLDAQPGTRVAVTLPLSEAAAMVVRGAA
jgi:two-component system, NarL family, sensor histidine kinase FusK